MKKIIIIFALLISSAFPALANGNWALVDSIRFTFGSIYGLECADSLNCMYFVGMHGAGGHLIKRTTDGGLTWKIVYKDSAYFRGVDDYYLVPELRDIKYPNTKLFIAVGDSGLILRSTDKGETWNVSRLDTFLLLYSIRFYDENIGFMFVYNKIKGQTTWYSTTDGGENWELIDYSLNEDRIYLGKVEYPERDLFAGGAEKKGVPYKYMIYIYNNDFKSIDTIPGKPSPDDLSFSGRDSCWLAGGRDLDTTSWELWTQLIYRTTDGGHSWEKQRDTIQNSLPLDDIKFYDHQFGMVSGHFALMLITEDGGKTWKEEKVSDIKTSGTTNMMLHIQIPSRNTAFVVGNFQHVYKWTRPPTSVIDTDIKFEISPNPASDYIDILASSVILSEAKEPCIKIFDVLGIEVLNGMVSRLRGNDGVVSGETVRLYVSHLSPGIYFISIGDVVQKFVKL